VGAARFWLQVLAVMAAFFLIGVFLSQCGV
jgi:hypothetical protein